MIYQLYSEYYYEQKNDTCKIVEVQIMENKHEKLIGSEN